MSNGELSQMYASHLKLTRAFYRPMWYSWNGMSQPPHKDAVVPSPGRSLPSTTTARNPSSLHMLLNPRYTPPNKQPTTVLSLPAPHIELLWKTFLRNVHPLVKVFFVWEVNPIVQQASRDPSAPSVEEQALIAAILLVSTLSLSESECISQFQSPKAQLLDQLQHGAEDALLVADYTTTTNMLTLQALAIYLVNAHFHTLYECSS
jgi:hypothetical protein